MSPPSISTFFSNPLKWLPKLVSSGRPRHRKTSPRTPPFHTSLSAAATASGHGGGGAGSRGFLAVFRRFDADGDGRVSGEELRRALGRAGEEVSAEEVERAVGEVDSDGDGLLDFGDFLQLVVAEEGGRVDGDLRAAFEVFEGKKGAGCITAAGLGVALGRLGEARTYEECAAMIRAYDLDGNGVLDFHEFYRMMTT